MAVTYSAWNSNQATASFTVTLASTALPAGAYLVVTWQAGTSSTTATIADSASGTWVNVIPINSTGSSTSTWLRTTPGTGDSFSVTVTANSSGVQQAIGTYYQGASGTYSTPTTATGTTAWPTLTTPSSVASGDLYYVVAGGVISTTPTWTAGSGYTLGSNIYYSSFGTRGMAVEYKNATSSGTTTATISTSASTTATKIQSFVIYASQSNFIGWGIPL